MKVFDIQPSIKNYEWGKIGLESAVASFMCSAFPDTKLDSKPYAEMWIGTHVSGPSTIPNLNDVSLLDWISANPECLGENIRKSFPDEKGLPFLFKVLSVKKPLSVQAHPDKYLAMKLHQNFPNHYPDHNHKPEMAIALTEFHALCGFRPLNEVCHFLRKIPQLVKIIGNALVDDFLTLPSTECFVWIFKKIMMSDSNTFKPLLLEVIESFKNDIFESDLLTAIKSVFLNTCDLYPGDIGCFCFFFLNYLKLDNGEAIFLAANEPHAYLFGDCIECMACSDNVVRAGLTPKFRDVETLCNMLTYNCCSKEENMFPFSTDISDAFIRRYNPPINEFIVDRILIPKNLEMYNLKTLQSASILFVSNGRGFYFYDELKYNLVPGTILFISSDCKIGIKPESDLMVFRAYC